MCAQFRTLEQCFTHEIEPIKASRFLAELAPVGEPEEAEAFVAEMRKRYADARHHCWAYRLGVQGERFRFSDDGEPGGSAGRPIYQQLEGHAVTDLVAVVVRWFGGTKLGVGGLIRAYGGAARESLDLAPMRTVVITQVLALRFPYECSTAVRMCLEAAALEPSEAEYGSDVRFVLQVPEDSIEALRARLTDATSGRVGFEE